MDWQARAGSRHAAGAQLHARDGRPASRSNASTESPAVEPDLTWNRAPRRVPAQAQGPGEAPRLQAQLEEHPSSTTPAPGRALSSPPLQSGSNMPRCSAQHAAAYKAAQQEAITRASSPPSSAWPAHPPRASRGARPAGEGQGGAAAARWVERGKGAQALCVVWNHAGLEPRRRFFCSRVAVAAEKPCGAAGAVLLNATGLNASLINTTGRFGCAAARPLHVAACSSSSVGLATAQARMDGQQSGISAAAMLVV